MDHTGQTITVEDQQVGHYRPSCNRCGWTGAIRRSLGDAAVANENHRTERGCEK